MLLIDGDDLGDLTDFFNMFGGDGNIDISLESGPNGNFDVDAHINEWAKGK